GGLQRSAFGELIGPLVFVEDLPDLIRLARRRAQKAKLDGLTDDQSELLAGDLRFGAFLHAERDDAQRANRRSFAGDGRRRGLDPDVVAARGPSANTDTAAALGRSEVCSASCDGEIEVGFLEHHRCAIAPATEDVEQTATEGDGVEDAAVEEHVRW